MSFNAVAGIMRAPEKPAHPSDYAVLLSIASFIEQKKDGTILWDKSYFPKVESIRERTPLSLSQCYRALDSLERSGWICRSNHGQRGKLTEYRILKRDSNSHGANSGKSCSHDANSNSHSANSNSHGAKHSNKPLNKSLNKPVSRACAREADADDRFQEFWDAYPHRGNARKGRRKAEQKFALALKNGATDAEIIAGANRYASDAQVRRGYAKDPTTWLNAQGWLDEVEQERLPPPSKRYARTLRTLSEADAAKQIGRPESHTRPMLIEEGGLK